jgi:tripartite-type tricarboxylate transporter receptor subunit TctC
VTGLLRNIGQSIGIYILIAALSNTAHAAGPITLSIGSAAGGGYDQYGRLTARYLQRELPGNPNVVAKNVTGAGGIMVLNWAYAVAPRDGTQIVTTQGSSVFADILGVKGAQYDPRQFNWLISLGNLTNMLLVWHTSPIMTADDVFKREMVLGNVAGDSAIIPAMLNRLIGTKFKVIAGYPGTNDVALALERGEVEGAINLEWGSIQSTRSEWLKDKKIRILMQVTFHPLNEMKDVPSLGNFGKNGEDRDMLQLLYAKQDIGRPYLAPPGTPASIISIQRAALMKIAKDPDFLVDAAKMQLTVDPTPGEDLDALVKRVYAIPQATIDKLHSEMKLAASGVVER